MKNLLIKAGLIVMFWIPCLGVAQNTGTFKVMHYNLLQFGNPCGNVTVTEKYSWLGDILEQVQPDILTVNEIFPSAVLARGIREISFDYTNQMEYAPFTNQASSDLVNMLFYNKNLFGYKSVSVIGSSIRDVNAYKMYLKPETVTTVDTLWFYVLIAHLKAGSSAAEQNARAVSAQEIRNWLDLLPPGMPLIMNGDFNISNAAETAWQTLVLQGDTFTRFIDPANKQNGWSGAGNAIYHTQSTRLTSTDCGSTSGMDDRFDFILMNRYLNPGFSDIEALKSTYKAVGNDGNSYDQELVCSATGSVPAYVCGRLKLMSDHLPVTMEFAYPESTPVEELASGFIRMENTGAGQIVLTREVADEPLWVEVMDITGRRLIFQTWERDLASFTLTNLPGGNLLVIRVLHPPTGRAYVQRIVAQP